MENTNLWGLYVVKWAEEITNLYKKFNIIIIIIKLFHNKNNNYYYGIIIIIISTNSLSSPATNLQLDTTFRPWY